MESCNALFFFIFLCSIWASDGKFFSLSSDWKVINNSSLPSYSTIQGPFRAVTDGKGNAIVSENNRTGLGFININNSGEFVLSVVLGLNLNSSPPAMEIWTANRNRKVAEGAVLKLGSNGDMVLQDSDGTVAWNVSTGKSRGILMAETGNFQIYNTTNSSLASASSNLVWQSWDYPTDTLVPGQGLKRGQELVSNLSATNSSVGPYKLVMEPGGLVLFYTNSTQEPYWSLGLPGLDYQGILRPCFYNSSSAVSEAVYTGQNLQVSFNGTVGNSSSSCANGTQQLFMAPFYNESEHRFLRLDSDGSLRVYRVSAMPGQNNFTNWSTDFELDPSNKNCILPRACGPYGICDNGQCTCPGYGTMDQFNQIQSLDVTQGCYSMLEPSCSQASVSQHYMRVESADYYPNDFLEPEANVSTTAECEALCKGNCSCVAAFFRNSSASCFLADGPLSSLKTAPNQTYKAYIKVLNNLPRNRSSGSNSLSVGSIAGIAVGSVAAALFICLIAILFVQHRRRSRAKECQADEEENDPDDMEEEAFLKTLPGLPPRFTYLELKEATDDFSTKLGTGGFGSVYEGVLKDGTRVAVKKLDGPRQGYKEFRAEVATIGSISHINLVRLHGFCAACRQRLLVYELLENGSLEKRLFARPFDDGTRCLTWEQRYNVAVGTARGLAYLHEQCREPIMHLDIKPQNILLDKNFNPKVSDFGMSKLLNDDMTQVMTAVRGTPGYLAPEWLLHSIATKKCDVYSFGMVLLELVSGRKNFEPSAADPRLCYFPAWAMLRALEGKYLDLVDKRLGSNSVDAEGVIRMTKVAFWCIQDNPNKRPWMSVALKMLEGEWDVPDAPMWLLERGPEFLEGYGFEPCMKDRDGSDHEEQDEEPIVTVNDIVAGPAGGSDESMISGTQLSGPR